MKLAHIAYLTVCLLLIFVKPSFAATYTYDELDRLQTVSYSSGKKITYSYDAAGNITATGMIILNTAPVITEGASISASMSMNGLPTPFSLTLHGTDANNDTLTWSIFAAASHGTATASGTGSSKAIAYVPTTGYAGTDSFDVSVADGNGGTASITVNVTVAVSAYSVTFTTGGNGTLSGSANQTVNYGASASAVTAVPATGYHFVNWTGPNGFTNTANPLTLANVTATQNIQANFAANQSQAITNFTPPTSKSYGDTAITLTATGGASGNPVTFSVVSGPGIVSGANNATLTITGAGTIVVKASQAGNATYAAAPDVTASINVSPKLLTVTASNASRAYGAANPLNPGFTAPTLVGSDAISSVTYTYAATATSTAVPGTTHAITPSAAVFSSGSAANYSISYSAGMLTIQADAVAPVLNVSTLASGSVTNNATLNVSGTVSDSGSGVKSLTVNAQTAPVANDGYFSVAVALVTGPNTITIVATDNADNVTTDTRTIILDNISPALTVATPADNSKTFQTFAAVTGTTSETSTVTVIVNGGTPQSAAINGNSFSATVNLAPGINTIDIAATDLTGNTSHAKRTVTCDTTAPSLTVSTPGQDISTAQESITISGTVSDAVTSATITMTADGQTYTPPVLQDGSFSQSIPLPTDKTYAVVVTATDQADNSTTTQRNIIKMSKLTQPTIADALKVFQAVAGITPLTDVEKVYYDLAPFVNGMPHGDGVIDAADVIVILRGSIGIVNW